MTISQSLMEAFRREAHNLDGVDHEVYRGFGRDPREPIIGLGPADARLAIFGRDPGREEVRHGLPFIGAGGQKVREGLCRHLHGRALSGLEESIEVGRQVFWANTVPYKPVGNKAWPMKVKRPFRPLIAEVLLTAWRGRDVLTLGREAFFWFGLGADRGLRERLERFWRSESRFSDSIEVELTTDGAPPRRVRLHPLPHPSPLNATWYRRFPDLLAGRLRNLAGPGTL